MWEVAKYLIKILIDVFKEMDDVKAPARKSTIDDLRNRMSNKK